MSEWTVDTVRENLLGLMEQRFLAQERAIEKQATETRENRIKDNEFRSQLRDQTATFPTRLEMNAKFAALEDKIASKNIQIVLSLGVGFVGILIAVFNLASRFAG